MVNWVEAQKPLVHGLVKLAGLRPHTVEIKPGTVISFWVPKDKAEGKKKKNPVVPEGKTDDPNATASKKSKKEKEKKEKPAVLLVHGFAAEGLTTWQFQIGPLAGKYDVYVPDLLFFGKSATDSQDRSPGFQAECLAAAMDQFGVVQCTVVGFSYGGMVAFKLAELRPDLVRSLVVSGSVIAMTDSISNASLERLGVQSSSALLLPESIKSQKALLSIATYKKLWFPNCLHRDYLEVMFRNRKERAELLDGLIINNQDATIPVLHQKVLLLWGENDNLFNIELARNMKQQLGEKATLQPIKKAGHLVHIERPCVYNRCLKEFLALVNNDRTLK